MSRHPSDCYLTPGCAAFALRRWLLSAEADVDLAPWLDPFAGAGTLLEWGAPLAYERFAFELDRRWSAELVARVGPMDVRIGRDSLAMPWLVRGSLSAPHDIPLAGGDIFEVYLRIGAKGSTVDELFTAVPWLGRGHVTRSLALLLRRKIVVTEEGRWFAAVEAPEVPTEPGRNDPLPEAAEIVKPKRRRAKDTGEQAINVALGQSEGMEASV